MIYNIIYKYVGSCWFFDDKDYDTYEEALRFASSRIKFCTEVKIIKIVKSVSKGVAR